MKKNPVVWWELASHDADASAEFFREVFDWDVVYDKKVGFYRVKADGSSSRFEGGGIFTLRKAKLPFLTIYIEVEDIEEKRRLIEENGGFVVIEPFEIESGATICLFNEPSGVTFAMIQSEG